MSNSRNSSHSGLPESESKNLSLTRKKKNFHPPFIELLSKLLKRLQITIIFAVGMLGGLTQLANKLSKNLKKGTTIAVLVTTTVIAGHVASAQVAPSPLPSLKTVSVPEPNNLGDFVKDKVAAIALGKALFWDMQVGSDGITACASCHFHAGADNRSKHQLSPGIDNVVSKGMNYQLKREDYPFHKLANPDDSSSAVLADTNDVTSSQGIFNTKFVDVVPGKAEDQVNNQTDNVFNVGGVNVRRVEPRNTPTVINAVFNFRNFWDGRAQNEFNGVNPFGLRDSNAKVLKAANPNKLEEVKITLNNSSLASQAVGPPLSDFEMSASDRTFEEIGQKFSKGKKNKLPRELGKKLLFLRPLGKQYVDPEDSVLGAYSRAPELGIGSNYESLIKAAFKSEWWNSNQIVKVNPDETRTFIKNPSEKNLATNEYTLMEYNFPLFFGLAVQMYEATQVSDDTPFDNNALNAQQQQGLNIFLGKGGCVACHGGAAFTTVANAQNERLTQPPIPGAPIFDTGFVNIGVRPTFEDPGVGGNDPSGNSLSEARLAQQGKFSQIFGINSNITPSSNDLLLVDGAMKISGLRNVELTAPYFHNGGQLTLEQVIDFYNRGGDFENRLPVLNLTKDEKSALVAFLKGLTDERVRYHRAPFDHPQLLVTNGHPGNEISVTKDSTGKATDTLIEIPAVGRSGLKQPLPNFLPTSTP